MHYPKNMHAQIHEGQCSTLHLEKYVAYYGFIRPQQIQT